MRGIIAIMIGGLVAAGCGGDADYATDQTSPENAAAESGAPLLRGYAVVGHEVRAFHPCGDEEAVWMADTSGLIAELHEEFFAGREPYGRLFAIVRGARQPAPAEGFGADYPGVIEIERVLYAGLEGPDCDFEWGSFHYRARGNEPFWMLEVSGMPNDDRQRRLRLVRPDEDDVLMGGFVVETSPDGISMHIGAPEGSVWSDSNPEVVLRRARCRDTMSGAYFGLSARFVFRGQTFTGCALIGDPPPGDAGGF